MYALEESSRASLSRSASVKVYVLEMTFEFGKFFQREYLVLRIKMRRMRTRMKVKMEQEALLQQQRDEEMIKLQSILHSTIETSTAAEAGSSNAPYRDYPPIYELEGSNTLHIFRSSIHHPLEYELDGSPTYDINTDSTADVRSTVDIEVESCSLTESDLSSRPKTEIHYEHLQPELPLRPTSEAGTGRLHKRKRVKRVSDPIKEKSEKLRISSTVRKSPNMQYSEDPELKQEADVLVMELSLVNVRQRQLNLSAAKAGVAPEELGDGKGDEYRELLQREIRAMTRLDEISRASALIPKERRIKSVAIC